MKICCEYCGQYFPETEESCPHCGAPNDALTRSGRAVPRTIEELKLFCASHNLPLAQMRFFIGEDYRGARAFGIYKDDYGVCTVYKNKSDGSRAIRYQGTDEAHAVAEIYQKLKSEIQNQRQHRAQQPVRSAPLQSGGSYSGAPSKKNKGCGISFGTILIVLAIFAALCIIYSIAAKPNTGYYSYGGDYYYYQNDNWYQYNSGLGSWYLYSDVDDALQYHAGDYYESYNWSQDYGVGDFSDSGYYHSYSYGSSGSSSSSSSSSSSWDSDWDSWSDSDWDWDSGDSWDSGWTDWDSDW